MNNKRLWRDFSARFLTVAVFAAAGGALLAAAPDALAQSAGEAAAAQALARGLAIVGAGLPGWGRRSASAFWRGACWRRFRANQNSKAN